ncbi:MAG: response regulator transcription factor [Campylobacterota bacterium]|nr:response regulator transcription factor [Campylobacterota bacterium]
MNTIKRNILLLEDDKLFAQTLIDYLQEMNFSIDLAIDGEEALDKSYENHYDLYLFDINVPKLNGIELFKTLRDNNIQIPTIFLTSYKDEKTLKECFENGCDDFLRKPFKVSELSLRINAVLKRTSRIKNIVKISSNHYYDFDERRVSCNNENIHLPLKVIQLLELFIENNNKIITTEQIVNRLWSGAQDHSDGSLRLYITKLRNIIGKEKIINIKKVGYEISGIIDEQ